MIVASALDGGASNAGGRLCLSVGWRSHLGASRVAGIRDPDIHDQQTKDVAKAGDLDPQTTESTSHIIPPLLSGGALVVGVVLIGAGFYQKH